MPLLMTDKYWDEQTRDDKTGKFQPKDEAMDHKPICANFSLEVSAILRDKTKIENRAQFIREAVREKLISTGFLSE